MPTAVSSRLGVRALQREKSYPQPLQVRVSHKICSQEKRDEIPVAMLVDSELLALSDAQMNEEQQEELSDLLAEQREGVIDSVGRERLDELMQIYRRGLVRKAEAIKIALERGLLTLPLT